MRESFRFFGSGEITISYSDMDDLTRQVLALAAISGGEFQQPNRDLDSISNRPL